MTFLLLHYQHEELLRYKEDRVSIFTEKLCYRFLSGNPAATVMFPSAIISSIPKLSSDFIRCFHFEIKISTVSSKSSLLVITSGRRTQNSKCALLSLANLVALNF